jgi:hypothetical protein
MGFLLLLPDAHAAVPGGDYQLIQRHPRRWEHGLKYA